MQDGIGGINSAGGGVEKKKKLLASHFIRLSTSLQGQRNWASALQSVFFSESTRCYLSS